MTEKINPGEAAASAWTAFLPDRHISLMAPTQWHSHYSRMTWTVRHIPLNKIRILPDWLEEGTSGSPALLSALGFGGKPETTFFIHFFVWVEKYTCIISVMCEQQRTNSFLAKPPSKFFLGGWNAFDSRHHHLLPPKKSNSILTSSVNPEFNGNSCMYSKTRRRITRIAAQT